MKSSAMIQRVGNRKQRPAVMPTGKVLALRQRDPWQEATARAREVASYREKIVHLVNEYMSGGLSQRLAVDLLICRYETGKLPEYVMESVKGATKKGRETPSRSTICAWVKSYNAAHDVADLLPEHKGRVVANPAWWGPALEYYNATGTKVDMSAVWRRLVEVDGFAVTYDQVRHYLSGVPAMYGRHSPARIGKNLYRLTQKAYIRRSTEKALPGDVYVADGYCADIYLAHPITGDIWRPELTVAIDLRSRCIVGWRADEHEGTIAVQNMWAECFAHWNHVPPFIYIDNGSGYKNKLMDDELTGFYARAGVQQIIHAIPGNPHGKGWVERTFRIIKDVFLKLWRHEFYCGTDAAQEVLKKTTAECKAGRMHPPSLAEFTQAFNEWIARFHNRPHPEDKTVTRAQVWSQLVPIPPAATLTELKRQAVTLTVRRASIRQGKRTYWHPDLHAFNEHKVILEYDLMDDSVAVIRNLQGRWICDAHLVRKIDAIAPNRLEEKRMQRTHDSIKRLEQKMDEQRARGALVIDADVIAESVATLVAPHPKEEPLLIDLTNDTAKETEPPLKLDLNLD